MKILKSMILLISICITGFAQTQIDITGIVFNDHTDLPIPGAVVRLKESLILDTTDEDGNFALQGDVPTAIKSKTYNNVTIKTVRNRFEFTNFYTQRLHASIINLRGRTIAVLYKGILSPGKKLFTLPKLSAGYYLCVIKVDNITNCMPFAVCDNIHLLAGTTGIVSEIHTPEVTGIISGLKAHSYPNSSLFLDTIIVTAKNFITVKEQVTKEVITFKFIYCKKEFGTVTDIDGNEYKTVKIGNKEWMAENLKTRTYNDSKSILFITQNESWAGFSTPAACYYENNSSNEDTYGVLYNWYAVNTGKLAPDGWHVPTEAEWNTLIHSYGGEGVAGGKLKKTGISYWKTPNTGATDESGFSALPGGFRSEQGGFAGKGLNGSWWSSSETNYCEMSYDGDNADIGDAGMIYHSKYSGMSVRCVKD